MANRLAKESSTRLNGALASIMMRMRRPSFRCLWRRPEPSQRSRSSARMAATATRIGGLQARLARHLPGAVLVLNDSELLLPAAGKSTGISVISGTGSIAVSRDAARRMIASGGWGWYLGDEGSASGLVREAARTIRFALDQGQPLDLLGRSLIEALAISSPIEIGRALGEIGSAAGIGRFAPLVFEAADAGSRYANKVITEAGASLAELTAQLLERGAPRGDVVTGGGVIARQPRLLAAFKTALSDRLPDLTLTLRRAAGGGGIGARPQAQSW